MKPDTGDELVSHYLRRLRAELRHLPQDRRQEVLDQIGEHIAECRSEPDVQSLAEVRAMLDRLGDPVELGADARERFGIPLPSRGPLERLVLLLNWFGPLLVLLPSLLLGLGAIRPWQIVPVGIAGLLWLSRVWRFRDKLIGSALLLGCVALYLILKLLDFQDVGLPSLVAMLLMVVVPFAAAGSYLQVRLRRLTTGPARLATA